MTKIEMARWIVGALYNTDALPAADNVNVARKARLPKGALEHQYGLAIKALDSVGKSFA